MAKRLEDPQTGMSRALKEALDAVERMGRTAARRNAAPESNKRPRDTPDAGDAGNGNEGGDDRAQRLATPYHWPPAVSTT